MAAGMTVGNPCHITAAKRLLPSCVIFCCCCVGNNDDIIDSGHLVFPAGLGRRFSPNLVLVEPARTIVRRLAVLLPVAIQRIQRISVGCQKQGILLWNAHQL
jgi:hypothetical protein